MQRFASSLLALAFITIPAAAQAQSADPLFALMAGSWIGSGERVQPLSGHRTRIDERTDSQVTGERLVSRNQITETPLDASGDAAGPSRSYERVYWIAPATGRPGTYLLGAGSSNASSSTGTFANGTFETVQDLGAIEIRSHTDFTPDSSVYIETSWQGQTQTSETRIEYHPAR